MHLVQFENPRIFEGHKRAPNPKPEAATIEEVGSALECGVKSDLPLALEIRGWWCGTGAEGTGCCSGGHQCVERVWAISMVMLGEMAKP